MKTYSHLESARKKPSDYEITSSELLYYLARGFEVATPIAAWYERYQKGTRLSAKDWESFRDPRETTYAKYVELQANSETFVDGLLRSIDGTDYDRRLDRRWLETLERIMPTLRFPLHGLQMIASYVAQMAPAGRIVVAGLFQAADEIRRIQRFAYRMRQLQETHSGFGDSSRTRWQEEVEWQPLRRLIETMMITFDWGEAFTALNLVVKPAFDALFMEQLASIAERNGDHVFGKMLFSFQEDCRRQREWTAALVEHAIKQNEDNRSAFAAWTETWRPRVEEALEPLARLGLELAR